MTDADLDAALYVRKYALEGLARSEGREPWPWMPGADAGQRHILRTDPAGSWVAEVDGMVIAFAQGLVRGDIWFLAQLFVHPDVHANGIGKELLRLAMDHGRTEGCRTFSVVSSTSPVAQSLYMRAGMFAFAIGYRTGGPVEPLLDLPEPSSDLVTVNGCADWQDQIAALDRANFGAERRQDHAYYLDPAARPLEEAASFALVRGDDLVGYAYVTTRGFIAPISARHPHDQLPLLRLCAGWLHARGIDEAAMWIVSPNQSLLGAVLERGWRIRNWSFLKANAPFGAFDRYHPSGGILL